MIDSLQGKVVVLTGGANGIGAAMVQAFIERGAFVEFCDIDRAEGEALAQRLPRSRCRFTKVDLRSEGAIVRWFKAIGRRHERMHVLINNAASDPRIPLSELSVKTWDDLVALNLRSMYLTARESVPLMEKVESGSIINFSSITFHLGPTEMAAYVSTKAGIQGLTRGLARELGSRRIRVNTLSPGWIMTERQLKQFVTPAVKRMLKKEQCIPELIQPDEVAKVALFLASDLSAAVTGQEILVDRGWRHS